MSFLDNEYKKRFSKRTLPSEQAEQDDLWAAIAGDLDKQAPAAAPKSANKGFTNTGRYLGWSVLLLLGAWSAYYLYSTQLGASTASVEGQPATHVTATPAATATPRNAYAPPTNTGTVGTAVAPAAAAELSDNTPVNSRSAAVPQGHTTASSGRPTDNTSLAGNNQSAAQTAQATTLSAAIQNSTAAPVVVPNGALAKSNSDTPKGNFDNNNTLSNTTLPNTTLEPSASTPPSSAATAQPITTAAPTAQSSTDNRTATASILALLPTRKATLTHKDNAPHWPHYTTHYDKQRKKKASVYPWQITVLGGPSITQYQYRANGIPDSIAQQKQASENAVAAYNLGIHAGWVHQNKWSISTGVEYQTAWSKFDYEKKRAEQIFKPNQLLRVIVDSSGHTVQQIYGDTTVTVESVRKVVHYNHFRQWAIPLELGYQKQTDRWLLGIVAGPTLQFTVAQAGKALDGSGNIAEFGQDSTLAPYKKMGIGVRVAPMIGYRPHAHTTLFVRPQWGMQFNNQLDNNRLKGRYQQWSLNVGVRFGF